MKTVDGAKGVSAQTNPSGLCVLSGVSATATTCMLVISSMMPPTASRDRAGKSRLEMAEEREEEGGGVSERGSL